MLSIQRIQIQEVKNVEYSTDPDPGGKNVEYPTDPDPMYWFITNPGPGIKGAPGRTTGIPAIPAGSWGPRHRL